MERSATSQVQVPLNAKLALRSDVTIACRPLGRETCYVIEDQLRSKFYRIGVREFTFVSLLDGRTSLGEALGRSASVLGAEALSEQDALALGGWLIDCQLATTDPGAMAERSRAPAHPRLGLRTLLRDPLFVRLPVANPEPWLERVGPWCGWLLGPWFFVVWLLAVGGGAYAASSQWDRFWSSSFVVLDPANWWRMLLAWMCLSLWHETFHALACKRFGGCVPRAGLALIFFMPAAFVDVTSSWRFDSKRQRIITAAAGIYAELFVAGLALIAWAWLPEGVTGRFCYDLAFMASLTTLLVNGNPLMRFDGYYILSDLLEIPNLAPRGRAYTGYLWQRWVCGFAVAPPPCPGDQVKLLKVYAIAAAVWRVVLAVTMSLTAIGMFSYLGMIVVALFVCLRVFVPAAKTAVRTLRDGLPPGRSKRGWAVCATGVAGCLTLIVWWLVSPGTIRARAVVEYAPLSVVRAISPGFVERVLVRDGEEVAVGQVLVVLRNDELHVKLADLELAAQQTRIRGRSHFQDEDIAKYQCESFELKSLEKKQIEARQQVEALTIRATATGRVIGRNLATLTGQYLEAGAELAVIGNEQSKELVIAVGQDDVEPFTAHMGQEVGVRVWGAAGGQFRSLLTKVDPRAAVECPHPALSAQVGGPLPVVARTSKESEQPSQHWELVTPVFIGTVALTPAESLRWQPGQKTTVSFRSATETHARLLWRWATQWMTRRIEYARSN